MIWLVTYNIVFWSLITIILWGYWQTLRSGWLSVKRLHQIPCSKCVYFTGNYRLKCPVNPVVALSIQAISCHDFLNKELHNE